MKGTKTVGEDIEMVVYKMLCARCPNAKRCYDLCETCEEYDEEVRLGEENGK